MEEVEGPGLVERKLQLLRREHPRERLEAHPIPPAGVERLIERLRDPCRTGQGDDSLVGHTGLYRVPPDGRRLLHVHKLATRTPAMRQALASTRAAWELETDPAAMGGYLADLAPVVARTVPGVFAERPTTAHSRAESGCEEQMRASRALRAEAGRVLLPERSGP